MERVVAAEAGGGDGGAALPANLGAQPLDGMMARAGLSNHDLVAASPVPIAHKLVMRARRGRRLTLHSKRLVVDAWNAASGERRTASELFDY